MSMRYLLLSLWLGSVSAMAAPLLNMVDVQGIRENQLVGYGLVVGLSGTGDKSQTKFTSQSIKNMLSQFGVQLPPNADPKLKNVAAVAISATLPALASKGQTLDITVSSLGDAKSLRGGTLLLTPLRGVDGQVYAMAQGNLVVGGLNAEGASGSGITVNIPTAGLIPNGALIEREIPSSFLTNPNIVLSLKQPGFNTARNIEMAINRVLGPGVANAQNNAKVVLRAPEDPSQRVGFMAALETLSVNEGPTPARIIFNARTGTIVMGQNVRVRPAIVSHGSLTVNIVENPQVSQPNALSNGKTVVTPQSDVSVNEERGKAFIWPAGTSLKTIVDAINSLGATPSDLMSILQALKQAGALEGELIVI